MQRYWKFVSGEAVEVLRTRTFITPQGDTEYHRVRVTEPGISYDEDGKPVHVAVGTTYDLTTAELQRNEAF